MKRTDTVIDEFVEGKKTHGKAARVWYKDDVLYSFGVHFPLMVRMAHWGSKWAKKTVPYLLNADRYSSTTSHHQHSCFHAATVQIPFSALFRAMKRFWVPLGQGVDAPQHQPSLMQFMKKLYLIDMAEEVWEVTDSWNYYDHESYQAGKSGWTRLNKSQYEQLPDNEKENCSRDQERRPQASVLLYEGRYFLSSMEGNNYFMSELPEPAMTVKDAFDLLVPTSIAKDVQEGNFKRQGEWYFVPVSEKPKVPKHYILKNRVLQNKNADLPSHHRARDYLPIATSRPHPMVRGSVRHQNRDHRRLLLGETWHWAIESRHIMSWGATGKVD